MASDKYFLAVTAIQNRLHAYILSLLADPVAAQEVLQETSLVLIRKADDFQTDASFESWAYNTARFQVLAHLRDRKRDRLVGKSTSAMKQVLYRIRNLLAACVEERLQEGTAG